MGANDAWELQEPLAVPEGAAPTATAHHGDAQNHWTHGKRCWVLNSLPCLRIICSKMAEVRLRH